MDFIKYPISISQRLRYLWNGIMSFAQPYIWVTNEYNMHWFEYWPWSERFKTFLAELETAILGYVYQGVQVSRRKQED